jgi:ribosomal protein S12 methylthiotransferase
MEKKVYFVSLGCPKNLVDSEIMLGKLTQADYRVTDDAAEADTIVVNTCGFIEASKKESIDTILEMSGLKKTGKLQKLVVAGCLTQRYKDDLVEGLPEADVFVGSGEFQNIDKILEENARDSTKKTFFNLPTYLQEDATPRLNSQPFYRAYLKISEGCMKRCAFCAIPVIRGNLQSRRLEAVVAEAKRLVASGVRELIVISHDFTDYGWDLRRKDEAAVESPYELLKALSHESGADWIRLLYLYPDGITPEMVELIKSRPNLVKYFDMPLQHINDEVLKRMNRKMTRLEIETALRNIREQIPEAVIRTQFIVGFPGETEEQFQELLEFVKEQEFDRVGCFMYSQEEKTAAGRMEDQVDEATKRRRHNQLMALQKKISRKKHRQMVGRRVSVLVEGYSDESELLLKGRSSQQAPDIDGMVYINDGSADVGDLVEIEIMDSMDYDLVGRILENPAGSY